MQIQISWLLQKPTDLDLHCLQRQDISRFSRTRVNNLAKLKKWTEYIATDKRGYPYNIFLTSPRTVENICCRYLLEAPGQGASNEYPQHMFS